MLSAITYTYQNQHYEINFKNLNARIPLRLKSGEITLVPWGRRKSQPGKLPLGGTIHLDSIYTGQFNKLQPRPVKVILDSFMIYDFDNQPHWYDNTNSLGTVQGIVLRHEYEQRGYIVVIQPDIEFAYHSMWPRYIF